MPEGRGWSAGEGRFATSESASGKPKNCTATAGDRPSRDAYWAIVVVAQSRLTPSSAPDSGTRSAAAGAGQETAGGAPAASADPGSAPHPVSDAVAAISATAAAQRTREAERRSTLGL